ncbi:MAG: hypothetical protein RIR70_961 [Pseudomonadota bacterium]
MGSVVRCLIFSGKNGERLGQLPVVSNHWTINRMALARGGYARHVLFEKTNGRWVEGARERFPSCKMDMPIGGD